MSTNNIPSGKVTIGALSTTQISQLTSGLNPGLTAQVGAQGQSSITMPMPGTAGGATYTFNSGGFAATVGIIGLGFVGNAIREAMSHQCTLKLIDSDPKRGRHAYQDLEDCDGIFVCVPTPQDDDGTCDTSILEDILDKLSRMNYHGVVISKCTAPPDVYEQLNAKYPNLIHAPEFLTAANAVKDYANGEFAIIGGKVMAYKREAERIIKLGQQDLKSVSLCSIGEASLAKYAINCFMSTKVIFMNELKSLADKCSLDYDKIAYMIKADKRIGNSHMQVPGPDGSFGFGGACFPKDTSALLKFAEQQGVPLNVLDAAVKKNTLLRLTEPK
jgi:UDPglucose 6-dehydrogenase